MAVRPIVLFPDPVLRQRCRPVERFDQGLAGLVGDLVETCHAAPGLGLAAPQIGVELRVAVIDLSVGAEPSELHVLVNPEIVERSGALADTEGCLSLPDLTERIERPERVRVRASGLRGEPVEVEGEGLLARALCHEIDHLDGVLFIDYLRGLRRELMLRRLRRTFGETRPGDVPRAQLAR